MSSASSASLATSGSKEETGGLLSKITSLLATGPSGQALSTKDLEALSEKLALSNSKLVAEIYDLAQRQLKAESERQTRLDAKATGLISTVGLSLTVVFTFGVQFLWAKESELQPYYVSWLMVRVLFGLAVLAGFASGLLAMRALWVRGSYFTMNPQSVFDADILERADGKDGDEGVALYRRYLLLDIWQMVQSHYQRQEHKALQVLAAQRAYFAFVCAMVAVGVVLVQLLLRR